MCIQIGRQWNSFSLGFGKCRIIGDPHYITFDGLVHHFQGKYTYILTQTIPDLPDTLTQFSVEGMNYPLRLNRRITYLKEVIINVYNHEVRFRQGKQILVSLSLTAEHRQRFSFVVKLTNKRFVLKNVSIKANSVTTAVLWGKSVVLVVLFFSNAVKDRFYLKWINKWTFRNKIPNIQNLQ